jgi:4-hydroxy-2-oxoheptanedioate aldolase
MKPDVGPRIGAWLNLPSAAVAETASRIGFDFVVIDMQHGLIDEATALAMLRAIDIGGAQPVVRTAHADPAHLGRMLDFGAEILIVPMIEAAADVATVIEACRYAPAGRRSYGPTRASLRHDNYFDRNEKLSAIYPMIETTGALADVERICAMDGVGGVFVGPADLSLSMGLRPARDQDDAVFVSALDRIVKAARDAGKVAGIQGERKLTKKRLAQGFGFLTVAMDSQDLRTAFQQSLDEARSSL